MRLKPLFVVSMIAFLLSACGISPQYHPILDDPTATPELVYIEEATPDALPSPYPQVLPAINPTYTAFSIHIQAVFLANDDGSDRSTIEMEQIIHWVDQANLIYSQASLRFYFDPGVDTINYDNSVLNNVTGTQDLNWDKAVVEGEKIAQAYGGKIIVLFRNPPMDGEVGSLEEDFIFMPSTVQQICGQPDESLLAHQIGHYLGLGNTFPQLFTSISEAEKAYEKSSFSAAFFDGDGLSDTPPDPYVNQADFQCGESLNIKIRNEEFNLIRGNLMSYYVPRSQLTPMQITKLRFFSALRSRNDGLIPSNQEPISPIQFEDLPLTYQSWCDPQIMDMSGILKRGWNGGKSVNIPSGYGSKCTYSIDIPETKSYELILYATKMPNYGVVEIMIDEWILNNGMDLYSLYPLPTGPVSFGTLYLEAGSHTLTFRVVRKALDSTNFNFGLDALTIKAQDQ
jgi:hypothetical protein